MKIVFMGSPAYAIPVLEALLAASAEVAGVYSQPDRPAGRGRVPQEPALKAFARERGIEVFQPETLRKEPVQAGLASLEPDVIVVAAYGKILPPEVLAIPKHGCVNVHPSLLPRHRGPSPVATAILDGDEVTGATVMLLDEGMDTGPTLAVREVSIGAADTTGDLTPPSSSSEEICWSTCCRGGSRGRWHRGLRTLHGPPRRRRFRKWTGRHDGNCQRGSCTGCSGRTRLAGLFTRWKGSSSRYWRRCRWSSRTPEGQESPERCWRWTEGAGVGIVTGSGVLRLERLQLEGRRPASAAEFVRGYANFQGRGFRARAVR